MKDITLIGIDLAKRVFHIVGVNKRGVIEYKKKVYRGELIETMMHLPRCTVVTEACGGSHYWAREFKKLGFEVKLIAPQFVKPFVKSNKNDWADTEAICEAAQRPTMRFCEVKTIAQQELQHLHRVRELAIKGRTALNNEIRGVLMEYGIVMAQGKKALRNIAELLEKHEERMTSFGRAIVESMLSEYWQTDERIAAMDKTLEDISKSHPVCQRLMTVPGVGPIVSTAIIAAVSDPSLFKNGRQFSAWLGLVPKQDSTGGKPRLLGISKRGDAYIRKQLIHGARSVLNVAHKKTDKLSKWATKLKETRGWNKASVAVANKNARILWALMRYEKEYVAYAA